MDLIKKVKSGSSKWFKTKHTRLNDFYWQVGYGAFSVKPSETHKVISYIHNQHTHHKKLNFQEEYIALLKEYNVKYNENYIWG